MTQQDKQLLLKDLCARLPYGVKIQTWYGEIITSDINTFSISINEIDIEQLSGMKPYLRPMSSMTEEEKEFVEELSTFKCTPDKATQKIDFYLSHYIDYRGLIDKGLALEAPQDMYSKQ